MPNPKHGQTTSERIYQDIRQSIILGRFRPGQRLNVDAVADAQGASNTPVREALQMLGQEGLVTYRPRIGYFVTQITLAQLNDLLELREILEVASVERAAARITDEQLKELEEIHTGKIEEDQDAARVQYIMENRRFHYLIARASGNLELAKALGRLHDRLNPYWVFIHSIGEMKRIHTGLVDAIREHDVDRARAAILDEVRETRKATIERVIREGGASWIIGEPISDDDEQ